MEAEGTSKERSSEPTAVQLESPRRVEVAGHELHLFLEAGPMISAMIRDIQGAQQRVWLEMYIFLNDGAGVPVAEALKERARAGVDVRVLYDAIGSSTTPSAFFQDMEKAGVQVHAFHTIGEALRGRSIFRVLNRRNHRKILVVDGRVAYFGGMNVADPVRCLQAEGPVPGSMSAGWRDVHVRLTGPQQQEIAESFERSWQRAHRQKVRWRPRAYRRGQLAPGEEAIQFFDTGPGPRYARAARIFIQLFRAARRSITLSMAYFVPLGRVLRELLRARRRGVRVRVIVPGESDVVLAHWAARYLYQRLLRRRIRLYERQGDMLHSKVMVVDNQWTVVGSSNLDPRSLWTNLEFLAVIRSRSLARALNEICQYEIDRSRRVTLADCYQRRCWGRLLDRFAWSLRWWL